MTVMLLLVRMLAETPFVASVVTLLPTRPELVSVFDPVPSNWIALPPWTMPPLSTVTFAVPVVPVIWMPSATKKPALAWVVRVLVALTVTVLVPEPAPPTRSAPTVPRPVTLPEPAEMGVEFEPEPPPVPAALILLPDMLPLLVRLTVEPLAIEFGCRPTPVM